MKYLTCVSVMALLPMLVASSQAARPAAGQGDAASCTALAGKTIAPNTVIQSADYLPDGGAVGSTKIATPFCRVIGVATPAADSHIGFEVWLPPASRWNGLRCISTIRMAKPSQTCSPHWRKVLL
jgi:hypothetical protein